MFTDSDNPNALVCFSHGQQGIPWGQKIRQLSLIAKGFNCLVESPDFTNIASPDHRAELLIAHLSKQLKKSENSNDPEQKPLPIILVGSSMGAYTSIIASQSVKPSGLFLMAPALYLANYKNQSPTPADCKTVVVHGWNDEVVPVKNAIQFSQTFKAQLNLVDDDHRLLDSMPFLGSLFFAFLKDVLAHLYETQGS